ncbi:hypothetical protein [Streptomyces sp. BRB081]|uniref:hypothetical protein n=1 Tax=Streptomyces sp. BRB081 TaxID=2769544 RepID=UPI0018AD0D64|nr:hypothetical protein [Streptomyces sp. BRB081]MBL3808475.1 hypothetical protein [Streptomyces sp. BRB081]
MTAKTNPTEAAVRATLATLADRYAEMAGQHADRLPSDFFASFTPAQERVAERAHVLRMVAHDLRDVLRTGRIPHGLMTDAELNEYGSKEAAR